MQLANSIANIPVPQGRRLDLSALSKYKAVPKQASHVEVQLLKDGDTILALKTIHKAQIPPEDLPGEYQRVYNEISILYQLKSPHIVRLLCHEETESEVRMLMEYAGIRLLAYLKRQKLSEEEVGTLTRQILLALQEIHDSGFVHRDLSSQNVLIDREKNVKLVDFGFANTLQGRKTNIGTICYMAPQIRGGTAYNYKVDIWSLGILVYEMLHQDIPFCSRKNFDDELFIENRDNMRLALNPDLSHNATDFIRRALTLNPDRRPSAAQLLRHQFVNELESDPDQIFGDRAGTEKKEVNKTHKISQAWQKGWQESGVASDERELKSTLGEVFASLHHHKDVFSDLIKTYQEQLSREMAVTKQWRDKL